MKHLSDNQFNNYAKAEQLERRVAQMEQYQRINGTTCANDKSTEDCLQKWSHGKEWPESWYPRPGSLQSSQNRKSESRNRKSQDLSVVNNRKAHHLALQDHRIPSSEEYKQSEDQTGQNPKTSKFLEQVNKLLGEPDGFLAMVNVNCRLCLKLNDGFHNSEKETDLKELLKYV